MLVTGSEGGTALKSAKTIWFCGGSIPPAPLRVSVSSAEFRRGDRRFTTQVALCG